MVGRRGFEPLKSKDSGFTVRPIWPLWNLPLWPAVKQLNKNAYPHKNQIFIHNMSQRRDSNPRPADYKSAALPAELLWQFYSGMTIFTISPEINKELPHFLGRQR
jgi:hypothetical protein